MKKLLSIAGFILGASFLFASSVSATSTLLIQQGGTSSTTLSGILIGNGLTGLNAAINTLTIGSGCTLTGTTLSCIGTGSTFGTTSLSALAPLQYSQSPLAQFSITQSGISGNGYLSSTDFNTFNNKISSTSLSVTTVGTSGASTYTPSTGIFNIPQYQAAGTYVTGVSATYPILSSGGTTPVISTAFGTTSTWGIGTNGFVYTNNAGLPLTAASSSFFGYIPLNPTRNINTTAPLGGGGNLTSDLTLTCTSCSTFGYPFTPSTFGIAVSATTTPLLDYAGFIAATSTFGTILASSSITDQALATAAGTFIAADPTGKLIATTTPSGSNSAFSPSANYATATALPSNTYLAGVITAVANGALSVDGANPSVGQRVLVKNESTAANNGLYDVTTAGSAIAAFVLTRDAQYNSSSNIIPGIITYVISGSTNDDDFWAMTSAAPITVGTTALNYVEVSGGGAGVVSVANSDSTLTITPTTGNVIASLNLGHSNTWSVLQNFTNATSSLFSATYASTTQLIVSGQSGCAQFAAGVLTGTGSNCSASGGSSFGQTLAIDASNWISATTTGTYGINANAQGLTYGFGIGDQLLAYASSTNADTIFGLGSGGNNATTSATSASLTAIGFRVLRVNTTGTGDTGVGSSVLNANTTGSQNSGFGVSTLATNTTGNNNTALGYQSLVSNTTGNDNTAAGELALEANSTGTNNTALGYQAGYSFTGYSNILVGDNSVATPTTITTGGGNIGLGSNIFFPNPASNSQLNIGNLIYGSLPATTTAFKMPTSGTIGIGTTSPFGKFSIAANNGDTAISLFNIGSSTQSATTTLFNISNTGAITTQLGNALVLSGGANTALSAYGGAAGCTNQVVTALSAVGATTCTSLTAAMFGNVTANTVFGNFTGASAVPTFTATSSLFTGSTGQFGYFSGTGALVGTSSIFVATNQFIGIGSTTPFAALSLDRKNGLASSTIAINEYGYGAATTTAETVDCRTSSQSHIGIGTSATTITITGMITGQSCRIIVENPNAGTPGALTWAVGTGYLLLWAGGTVPTATATNNKQDVYSFIATKASSTVDVLGAQSANF